jgi:hypothetical protein
MSNELAVRFALTSNRRSNHLRGRSSKPPMPDCGFDSPGSRRVSIERAWSRTFPGAVFQSREPRGVSRSAAASGRSAFEHWGVRRSPMRHAIPTAPASSKRSAKGSGARRHTSSRTRSFSGSTFTTPKMMTAMKTASQTDRVSFTERSIGVLRSHISKALLGGTGDRMLNARVLGARRSGRGYPGCGVLGLFGQRRLGDSANLAASGCRWCPNASEMLLGPELAASRS